MRSGFLRLQAQEEVKSTDDFSVHDDDCDKQEGDWMPISNLPDEVTSIEDLDCECWGTYDSLDEYDAT